MFADLAAAIDELSTRADQLWGDIRKLARETKKAEDVAYVQTDVPDDLETAERFAESTYDSLAMALKDLKGAN